MTGRVFCDSGVLIRYFAEDDLTRAIAALDLIESEAKHAGLKDEESS